MLKLVKFYTTWCVPCKMLTPILNQLKQEFNLEIEEINADNGVPEEYSSYNIMSTPTVLVFKDGKFVEKIQGLQTPQTYKETIQRCEA